MGVALQCPDCGFKHRLDSIGDRAVFSCARCSRELKVPAEYRVAATAAPATNGSSAPSARSGTRTRSSPVPHAKHRVGATPMRLPVRILLWVVAFVLGALVVRFLAKITGFAGGDTFFDLLIDGSMGTYLRLFALVPVWALFATLFATAFIDGPRAWARRKAGATSSPSGSAAVRRPKPASAAAPAVTTGAGVAAGTAAAASRNRQRSIPRREPAPVATPGPHPPSGPSRLPEPPPVAPAVTRTSTMPLAGAAAASGTGAADDGAADFTARAAAGQRPRRIPRRGAGS